MVPSLSKAIETIFFESVEIVAYGVLTLIIWFSSFTFLLPLVIVLKCNRNIRNKWFSWIYNTVIQPLMAPAFEPIRKQCFEMLNESLGPRNVESSPLKVLEIGIGLGSNLQYYPVNSSLTALDMNVNFEKYLPKNPDKYPNVKLEKFVVSMAEDMKEIPSNSFDVVIGTWILCSVENVQRVVDEVLRVLSPGGYYVFTEHVAYPRPEAGYWIQRLVHPLWFLYFNGCNTDRTSARYIDKAGFSVLNYKNTRVPKAPFYVRPVIFGLATK